MQKTLSLFLLLVLCCFAGQGVFLYAQEEEPPAYDESIPDGEDDGSQTEDGFNLYIPDLYSKGDQTITISLGTVFPTVFYVNGAVKPHNIKPPVGGVLSLAYCRFLGPNLFLGGEAGFLSAYTLGQGILFIIPIGFRAGWQFVLHRFEIPLYAAIGIAPQRYLDLGYFGMYLKGAASAYFRYNSNWSFGLNIDWSWYPQWPMKDGKRTPEKDVYANILGVTLSARYHF
ncbi:MAG: hypothetical protein LBU85_03045 [Treponema sp.]|jgi:hypothetical protein|nr:hypothetical protein [Treponema sp.]